MAVGRCKLREAASVLVLEMEGGGDGRNALATLPQHKLLGLFYE